MPKDNVRMPSFNEKRLLTITITKPCFCLTKRPSCIQESCSWRSDPHKLKGFDFKFFLIKIYWSSQIMQKLPSWHALDANSLSDYMQLKFSTQITCCVSGYLSPVFFYLNFRTTITVVHIEYLKYNEEHTKKKPELCLKGLLTKQEKQILKLLSHKYFYILLSWILCPQLYITFIVPKNL